MMILITVALEGIPLSELHAMILSKQSQVFHAYVYVDLLRRNQGNIENIRYGLNCSP